MTLDACGRDWRPSVPLEITPPPRWEQILCWRRAKHFYGRFDRNGGAPLPIGAPGSSRQSSDDDHVITVSEDEVRRELRRVNIRKAAGPDGITGRVLRSCADQLAGLLLPSLMSPLLPLWFPPHLRNLSSSLCLRTVNPLAWMTIVQLPSHQQSWRFWETFKEHICSSIPATLDPLQLPIAQIGLLMMPSLRCALLLTHIDSKNGNYVRLLFIDYSSAFNTIVPPS